MKAKYAWRLITFTLLLSSWLHAQDQNQDSTAIDIAEMQKQKKLRFSLAPYAWLAGMATDVGGERIRQSFNDLSSITNLGFQVMGRMVYKKWSLSSNLTYANLQAEESISSIQVDLDIVQIIWDNKIGYLVIDRVDQGDDVIRGWSMEATAGVIYWSNDLNVSLTYPVDLPFLPQEISELQNWTDLVVGANFRIYLSKTVLLALSGNVGGFGIGNSSQRYYDLFYANTFRVKKWLSVTAGYKTFTYEREDGTGEDLVKTKVKTFGPLIGVAFHI